MLTYQDFLDIGSGEEDRAKFVLSAISAYRNSDQYKTAQIADEYDRGQDTTITNYQKKITLLTGEQVEDRFSATHRSSSNFFYLFTTFLAQYLLSNGANLSEKAIEKLGKDFDIRLQQLGKKALCGGVSYGCYDQDHVDVFTALEFFPFLDEENGGIGAGVRFWQLDPNKPLRAKLYELDGYTSYMWVTPRKRGEEVPTPDGWERLMKNVFYKPKRAYVEITVTTEAEGTEVIDGQSYPGFPIIPLYANDHHQSELVPLREKIDAYDFILNGFEDDLDNAQLYWIISGAGGSDDTDLMQFLERLKTIKAAAPSDGQSVQPVQVDIPYAARETLLNRLQRQLYADAMILNPEDIAAGAVTATQIRAAYERQNVKADQFEYQVLEFLYALFKIAGIEGEEPSFTRSTIVNVSEEMSMLLQAAQFLPSEYVTRKALTLLGDVDKADELVAQMQADEYERLNAILQQTESGAESEAES